MPLSRAEDNRFMEWLARNTDLSERSARDVLSRLRRVMVMTDPLEPAGKEELVFRLSEHSEYQQASTSVKSQLKRAAMLYRRFCREQERES